eukprot:TRINITY_DN10667_c0_g1_i1.p1 TRINITY_DN10667_c0_g1~~TRINITY_DN10667_c0_g1_i1.p1  ORF type:complete len:947 (-),score=153.23 TRINITY_DN10667_c0_g1_i1:70-2910(-)
MACNGQDAGQENGASPPLSLPVTVATTPLSTGTPEDVEDDDFGWSDEDEHLVKNSQTLNSWAGNRVPADQEGSGKLITKNSYRDRVAYLVDRVLAKRSRFFMALFAMGFLQLLVCGAAYSVVWQYEPYIDDRPEREVNRFVESIWESWSFFADPGVHARVYRPEQRVVAAGITLLGILFFSSVLGLSVDFVRDKMDSIRQGKSRIIETDHTLILGWTEKTIHIVAEIIKANESEGGGVIAILAPRDKVAMEFDMELQIPTRKRKGTRIVFRTGSPLVMSDLIRVNIHMARAIIILASTHNADQADSDTLRTMLTIQSLTSGNCAHCVAEVCDIDNEPLVKLVGGDIVETLVSHDVIGRLMLMSVRQPGLAKVYEALLGFDGDEFYMAEWPELVGLQFGELIERFPDAIPIGLLSVDGVVTLRPDYNQRIAEGDQLLVIAEDNDTYEPVEPTVLPSDSPPAVTRLKAKKEKVLFCGWRRDVRDILQQLDGLAAPGTEIHMMTHCVPIHQREAKLMEDGLDVTKLKNIRLVHYHGNTSVRRKLEVLPIEDFSSCLIFADQAFENDTLHADSHSLATLLLIRDIQSVRRPLPADEPVSASSHVKVKKSMATITCPIICEVLDPHTQKTIVGSEHLSLTSDFCQTNKLIAQMLAMVAEERVVSLIFHELLGTNECEIAVVPSSRYTRPGERLSFFQVSRRAFGSFNELILGFQQKQTIDKTALNPHGKSKVRCWDRYDFAILRGAARRAANMTVTDIVDKFQNMESRDEVRSTLLDAQEEVDAELEARARKRKSRRSQGPATLNLGGTEGAFSSQVEPPDERFARRKLSRAASLASIRDKYIAHAAAHAFGNSVPTTTDDTLTGLEKCIAALKDVNMDEVDDYDRERIAEKIKEAYELVPSMHGVPQPPASGFDKLQLQPMQLSPKKADAAKTFKGFSAEDVPYSNGTAE